MAGERTVKIRFTGDAKGLNTAGKQAESAFGRIKGRLKDLAAAAGIAFGAEKVVDFLKDSVSAASDLNETVSKSKVIFGQNQAAVMKWSKTAAVNLGLSQQAALDAATSFGDMFHQIGFTGDAAAKNSTKVVQLATDLGSFNNLPTADVLDMISGAFRGEYDSIQRIIPNISAARVQQEALNETHKKSVNDLTAHDKALATMAILTKDGARAQGDFARTSGGLANQQKILAAKFEDIKAKVGTALLPILLKFTSFLSSSVVPNLVKVGHFVQQNSGMMKVLGAVVIATYAAYKGITAVTKVWTAVTKAQAIAQGLLNVVMTANPIGLVVVAIGALVAAFVIAWQKSQQFREVVSSAMSGVASGTLEVVKGIIKGLKAFADAALTAAITVIGAFAKIPGPQQAALKNAEKAVKGFKAGVDKAMGGAVKSVEGWQKSVNNMPKEIKLRGRIDDLNAKIEAAKKKLKDPHLTKPEAARIRANITDLIKQRDAAQRAVDRLHGKTIKITADITDFDRKVVAARSRARIRLDGFAKGTPSAPAGLAWVGENGPELVNFRGGERVYTASQSAAMAGGPSSITIPIQIGDEVVRTIRVELDEFGRSLVTRAGAGVGSRKVH